ncbi:transcriptional activator FtrA [Variibacter gotjawalensis]|uniref:Transcriptional activator FtrA n=1 Tax=Variibacter gotjawalensis TaxID=1333996 RepID=A0A0S3Q020_9BRAD|nr:AraC family transcriptional regulator [Variibacter gotjawalensis]BAT61515.1 transcriptional activator FtrA [Variibacter gotjawalensis]
MHIEHFSGGLMPRTWTLSAGRARLLVLESRHGVATAVAAALALSAPALLWLPSAAESELRLEAGARGYLISVTDDFLARATATAAEAVHLRRVMRRVVPFTAEQARGAIASVTPICRALLCEQQTPGRGATTMISTQTLLLLLHLWRTASTDSEAADVAQRGEGPRLIAEFLQLVELHHRDSWAIARYAAALGVTEDKLHAHCRREKSASPRALLHERLAQEACTRLLQLDLPVEQIGYGLGFRDPAYFNRFFKRHRKTSPGLYRRQMRSSAPHSLSYAAWP